MDSVSNAKETTSGTQKRISISQLDLAHAEIWVVLQKTESLRIPCEVYDIDLDGVCMEVYHNSGMYDQVPNSENKIKPF